jgi:hypothetical protein
LPPVPELVVLGELARATVDGGSVVGTRMTHHNGAAQVFAEAQSGSRFVWTADLLPDEVAPVIEAAMEQAMPIIKATLERAERDLAT